MDFATFARELRPGVESVTSDTVNEYLMSTGSFDGDGNQASHWKDDFYTGGPFIGIMDPTLGPGTFEPVSDSDLRAMELIGYDTVPEPRSMGTLTLACLGLLARRQHRPDRDRGQLLTEALNAETQRPSGREKKDPLPPTLHP